MLYLTKDEKGKLTFIGEKIFDLSGRLLDRNLNVVSSVSNDFYCIYLHIKQIYNDYYLDLLQVAKQALRDFLLIDSKNEQ